MDSWAGKLDNVPFHIYSMKEPDYVMLLMLHMRQIPGIVEKRHDATGRKVVQ